MSGGSAVTLGRHVGPGWVWVPPASDGPLSVHGSHDLIHSQRSLMVGTYRELVYGQSYRFALAISA